MPRSRRRRRCRPTAGCSGWPKASRSARSRRCSPRCAARSTRAPRRRRRATAWRPSWPSPTARLVSSRGRGGGAARSAAQAARRAGAAARGGARGCARLARFAGAGAGRRRDPRPVVAARDARGVDRAARRGSAARPIPNSSTGWRSSGSTGANMTSASTATGSIRPSRSRAAVLAPAHGVLVTSATLRGGEDWAAAEARTGALHLPAPAEHFEADSPFDYAACSEVLIVTDIKQRRHRRARRRLCPADRGGGGRHARPVHRDPAAEGGARPHRRPAGARRAAAARPACRPDRRRHPGRHLPRRSARVAARHRCAARRRRRARRIAAAGGDGARAVAAPDRAPRGAADGRRRQRL